MSELGEALRAVAARFVHDEDAETIQILMRAADRITELEEAQKSKVGDAFDRLDVMEASQLTVTDMRRAAFGWGFEVITGKFTSKDGQPIGIWLKPVNPRLMLKAVDNALEEWDPRADAIADRIK